MNNPAVETKLELVTEAIEALVLATVVGVTHIGQPVKNNIHQNIVDARQSVHDALQTLLTPTLRVVTGGLPQKRVATEFVPYGGEGIDGMNLA